MVVGAFSKGANTAYLADCSRRGLIAKAARPTVRVVARRVRWPPARLSSDHIPSMIINGIPPNRSGSTDFKTTMMHRPESVFLKGIGIFRSNGGGSSLTCGTAKLAERVRALLRFRSRSRRLHTFRDRTLRLSA